MKPQDWFGLALRLLGIWLLWQSYQSLLFFLDVRLGFTPSRDAPFSSTPATNANGYLLYMVGYGVLGWFLAFAPEPFVKRSYRDWSPSAEAQDASPTDEDAESESEK